MRLSHALTATVCLCLATVSANADATVQTFDGGGTPFVTSRFGTLPGVTILGGGPSGSFARLTTTNFSQLNTLAFARTELGAQSHVVGSFDFRIGNSAFGGADGIGFALLNTANFGIAGGGPPISEDPNLVGSLGVGFDTFNNFGPDPSDNHVSLHLNNTQRAAVPINPAVFNLENGVFNRVTFELFDADPGTPGALFSLSITPNIFGTPGAPITVFNNFNLPDFVPFEFRAAFGARTGGAFSTQDIDNVNILAIPEPGTLSLLALGIAGLAGYRWRRRAGA